MSELEMKQTSELVFIPGPGAGHIRSAVEFAYLLTCRNTTLSITLLVITVPSDTSTRIYLDSLPKDVTNHIHFIDLPLIELSSDTVSDSLVSKLSCLINSQIEPVRAAVTELMGRVESGRLVGFIIDMFCTPMIDIANEFGVPTYVFFTSPASFLGFKFYIQTLKDFHNLDITKYKQGSEEELSIPGFINPVPAKVFPSIILNNDGLEFVVSGSRRLRETKGIVVNTFLELETNAIKSLSADPNTPPVYSVGPILSLQGSEDKVKSSRRLHNEIMEWLDDQPSLSVVFLCFGSMGSFKEDQVKEIAHALESSQHLFLWSLRQPPQEGTMKLPGDYENLRDVLPEGFLERNAERGKVIGWAPQGEVLAHSSVGGFVTHCGWNSILESLWCGVPVATWPIYAEQQIKAFLMVVELGLAVEIKLDYRKDVSNPDNTAVVMAGEIERGIKLLMDPENVTRNKVKEMTEKCKMALMEGGSSYNSLASFIHDILMG